jgi:hypothetical protein
MNFATQLLRHHWDKDKLIKFNFSTISFIVEDY